MRAWALLVGAHAVEAVAVAQQLAWHRAHPDAEPFGNVFLAHAPIYAACALGAVAAGLLLRARVRAGTILVASFARGFALVVDGIAHHARADPTLGHAVYRIGAALAALGVLGILLPRESVHVPARTG